MKTIIRILIAFFASFVIGSANTALVTDANGSVSFDYYGIDLSSSFSIQSWSKAYDQTNYYSWNWVVGGSTLAIGHVNGTIQGLVNNGSVGNAGAFTYNNWVHTVLTYDAISQTYTLYKDGVPYSFAGAPNLGLVNALVLGGKNGNEYLNGELDEIAIWNTTLTSLEVAELYNGGLGKQANINSGNYFSSSNLTLYFTFENTLDPIIGVAGASTINGTSPSFTTVNTLPIAVTNTAPIVNQTHYFSIDENLPIGSHVGDIIATDNENDPLFYTLSGTDSSFFEINASGSIFALQSFNFEVKNYYFFDVTVSDGNYSAMTTVDVNINDINETLPTNLVLSNVFTQTDLENAIASVADGGTIEITNPANILLDHQIIINKNITIMALANFVLDGNFSTNIINIYPGFNVALIGLTMQNGHGIESGGGIRNEGNLQLQKSIIRNNMASMGSGGGIENLGTLFVADCSIYDNNATYDGGGVYNSGSSLLIINSTVSQNGAIDGGGVYVDFGEANISHSTITRNVSGIGGVPNTATGGGLYNFTGTVNLKNTIIANNFDIFDVGNDCSGAGIFSLGFNAIGDCQVAYTPDDINGSFIKMTPIDTYYPMPIHKIYSSSQNAIVDVGSCTDADGMAVDYDQLGMPRPFGLGCDIGAVEYDSGMIIQNSDDGNAFEFNGINDYALAPASTSLVFGLNQDFAISFWIKIAPTQNDTNSTLHTILTDYQYAESMNIYSYFFAYDDVNKTILAGRQDGFDDAPTLTSATQFDDGGYHHVAYVKNGIDLFLYVDGMLEDTVQDTNIYGFNHLPTPIIAGGVPEMSSAYLTGTMDELSFWNRALTQNEILSNMYGTLMGDEANLVAYYKFDALTGAMIFDEKTLNDFTLYGSGDIGWIDSMAFGVVPASASISINPASISFGDIPLYGYAEQNITIENNSSVELYINTIYLQYNDGIATLNTAGCSSSTLAPYTSCSIAVGVSPTHTGTYGNSVAIDTNGTLGLVYIPISANGVDYNTTQDCTTDIAYCYDYTACINAGWGTICESYFPTYDYPSMYTDEASCITAGYYWDGMYCVYPLPSLSINPASISFGDIPLYGYAEQNITIENNSSVELYINTIYLQYNDGIATLNTAGCSNSTLAPYTSCSIAVGVSPTHTGTYGNSVAIDTNGTLGLVYIPISANGVDYNATTVYLTGISISPLNQEVEVGNSILFNAYANYSDNTSLDITNQAIWSAEYGTIANGEYTTGNTIGDDFITAVFEQFSLTIPVKVIDFNNTTIEDCTTDIIYCYDYTGCINAGWGIAICESSFPTYDYPEMYTDEASCITAGYYWNMTYCSYEAVESHISIEFGGNTSEVDYTNALALDPSVLYGKSFYSLSFKDYILKSERIDIASSSWMIYGLDSALNYTKKTEELNTTTINNIMTSSKFDIKYLGGKDADGFNTTEFDIFTSNAKAYEFITTRKVDEYLFHDLQINYDTQMPYNSFDEFITDRNGTAYFMNKKDSYDTGIAFNTTDYSTGDRSGVIAEVKGLQVIDSNIGNWSVSFVEEVGTDVLFIYPDEEYRPYYYRAIFAINSDGDLQRGEHQAIGDVYKFVLFDAAGHNEFSEFIELNYNIAVPLDVQDVIIEPEEPVVTISSLIISPLDINVTVSSSLQFSVSAKYSDNNISDVTDKVVWSALKGTISSSGLYTATDIEEIDTITATFEGFSISATVRILLADIEPEPEATFTVEVVSGWNLMSLPTRAYMSLGDLIETFGVNAGKIDYLAKYDSIGWSYFLVDVHNETVDRFTSLSSNEGFWLKASTGFELKYAMPEDSSGADEVSPLGTGWNLVGFNSDKTPQMIKNLYAGYTIESIWIYKNGKWSVYIPDAAKNALVSTTIPRITNISKFDGVWINVK